MLLFNRMMAPFQCSKCYRYSSYFDQNTQAGNSVWYGKVTYLSCEHSINGNGDCLDRAFLRRNDYDSLSSCHRRLSNHKFLIILRFKNYFLVNK